MSRGDPAPSSAAAEGRFTKALLLPTPRQPDVLPPQPRICPASSGHLGPTLHKDLSPASLPSPTLQAGLAPTPLSEVSPSSQIKDAFEVQRLHGWRQQCKRVDCRPGQAAPVHRPRC